MLEGVLVAQSLAPCPGGTVDLRVHGSHYVMITTRYVLHRWVCSDTEISIDLPPGLDLGFIPWYTMGLVLDTH